jgi:RNA polymerase sigma factor (sigma-70 family)
MVDGSLEDLVRGARNGDRECLERLVLAIQDRVHGLALRMLWNPEDARDATQDILIRVVTRLGSFRGRSAFTTWVYRVAANHLLTVRKSGLEERYDFQRFGRELDDGLSDETVPEGSGSDTALLLEEASGPEGGHRSGGLVRRDGIANGPPRSGQFHCTCTAAPGCCAVPGAITPVGETQDVRLSRLQSGHSRLKHLEQSLVEQSDARGCPATRGPRRRRSVVVL